MYVDAIELAPVVRLGVDNDAASDSFLRRRRNLAPARLWSEDPTSRHE
jgi:hypothetical protein